MTQNTIDLIRTDQFRLFFSSNVDGVGHLIFIDTKAGGYFDFMLRDGQPYLSLNDGTGLSIAGGCGDGTVSVGIATKESSRTVFIQFDQKTNHIKVVKEPYRGSLKDVIFEMDL